MARGLDIRRHRDMGELDERFGDNPMPATTFRSAGALRFAMLGLASLELIVLPSSPTTKAGMEAAMAVPIPTVDVNRTLKGDRLPTAKPDQLGSPVRSLPLPRARIPPGCDAAFSPISSPSQAQIFGRCTT